VCIEYLKKGRGVRVVGRLDTAIETGALIITAEHVEFKPQFKQREEEHSAAQEA